MAELLRRRRYVQFAAPVSRAVQLYQHIVFVGNVTIEILNTEAQDLLHGYIKHRVVVECDKANPLVKLESPPFDLIKQRGVIRNTHVSVSPNPFTLPDREVKVVSDRRKLPMALRESRRLLLEPGEFLFHSDPLLSQ